MTHRTVDVGALLRDAAPTISAALDGDLDGAHEAVTRTDRLAFVERGRVAPALRDRLELAYRSAPLTPLRELLGFDAFVEQLRDEARRGAPT